MEIDTGTGITEIPEFKLSPNATSAIRDNNFKNIDHQSLLSAATGL